MATPEDLKVNADYIRMADRFVKVPGGTNNNNYANVDFLVPLFSSMTSKEPGERPTAEEALAQWRKIRRGIWSWQRMRPLRAPEQGALKTVALDIIGFFQFGLALSRRSLFRTADWCTTLGRRASPVA